MNENFNLLHNRNFLKLWTAQVFSQVAIHSINFVLIITTYSITNTNRSVSTLIIVTGLAAFLFGVPAGVLSDHLNRKSTLFWTSVIRFIGALTLILVGGSYYGILIFAFLLNSISQFFYPSEASSIPSLVKKDHLISANSLFSITYYIAQVTGYLAAGLTLAQIGYSHFMMIASFMFLMAAIFIRQVIYPNSERNITSNRVKVKKIVVMLKEDFNQTISAIKKEFTKGFSLIKRNRKIKISFIYLTTLQVIIGMVAALIPGFAVEILNVNAEKASLYMVAPLVVGLLSGSAILSRFGRKIKEEYIVHFGVFIASLGFAIVFYLPSINVNDSLFDKYFIAILAMFLIGFANSLIYVISNTRLQSNAKEGLLGRIYGALQTAVTIVGFLPVLFSGVLADFVGVNYVFLGISITTLVLHLSITFLLPYFSKVKV